MKRNTLLPLTKEFPALGLRLGGRRMIYLDSACTALKMKSAAELQKDFLLELGGCGGRRSSHSLSGEVEGRFSAARAAVAEFAGADSPRYHVRLHRYVVIGGLPEKPYAAARCLCSKS